MTWHPGRTLKCWVTSAEIWAVLAQKSRVNWARITLWHRGDCGLQAQLEEMVWAGGPEIWLVILSQMWSSFITDVKCHKGISTFDHKIGKSIEIINGSLCGPQEQTEHKFKWKNGYPGACDCVLCIHKILKVCGNPREKFQSMWLVEASPGDACCQSPTSEELSGQE